MHAVPQEAPQPTPKIAMINGLRGVAILGVVLMHLYGMHVFVPDYMFTLWGMPLFPLTVLTNGFQGVTLFFILSGFVLALPYEQGKRQMTSLRDALRFYRRRAARLVPLYVVVSLAGIALRWPEEPVYTFFLYITVSFIFSNKYFFPYENGPLWTLGLEFWFSVLMPFLIFAQRWISLRVMLVVFCILGAASKYWSMWVQWSLPIGDGITARLFPFVLGMYLAKRHEQQKPPLRFAMVIGLALLFLSFWMSDFVTAVLFIYPDRTVMLRLIHPAVVTVTAIALGFITDALLRGPRGISHVILERPFLQLIGLMCYSIYVWHELLIMHLPPARDVLSSVMYFIALATISWYSYLYIEFRHIRNPRALLPARK